MVVWRAVFRSLVTNGADPVGLLHSWSRRINLASVTNGADPVGLLHSWSRRINLASVTNGADPVGLLHSWSRRINLASEPLTVQIQYDFSTPGREG